jgi:hypothetical protein
MNRAARIAEKAGSGQVWCSRAVWDGSTAEVRPFTCGCSVLLLLQQLLQLALV